MIQIAVLLGYIDIPFKVCYLTWFSGCIRKTFLLGKMYLRVVQPLHFPMLLGSGTQCIFSCTFLVKTFTIVLKQIHFMAVLLSDVE